MPKKVIPKGNAYFEYHNENPKGRKVGDCVQRACAFALNIPWHTVLQEQCELALKIASTPSFNDCYTKYIEAKGGIKHKQPRKPDGKKYTVKQFINKISDPSHKYIVSLAGHLSVVYRGKVYDTWDCSEYTVGVYWDCGK